MAVALAGFKIGFPGIDRDHQLGIFQPPQFAAFEAHGIKPLRILARARCVAVRKDMAAVEALDRAHMAANIARQPRMPAWMNILGAHSIARLEPRRRRLMDDRSSTAR